MIKVLVFDSGWAAVKLGNYIEKELPVSVEKIIDRTCRNLATAEDLEVVERRIKPYIGEVAAIVFANPIVAASMGSYLETKYPAQKFIFYGYDLPTVAAESQRVMILTPAQLRKTAHYQMMKAKCQVQKIRELNYKKWVKIAKDRELFSKEEISSEIGDDAGERIIINSAELMVMEDEIKRAVDWRAEVIDLSQGVVTALKEHLNMGKNLGRVRYRTERPITTKMVDQSLSVN